MADPSTIEALLKSLGDDDDDDKDEAAEQKNQGSNPVADLRNQLKEVLKEKKATDKALQEAQEVIKGYKGAEEAKVFAEAQLGEDQVKLFKAMNPEAEVTADLVSEFMQQYGITPVQADADAGDGVEDSEEEPSQQENPTSLAPTRVPGSAPGVKQYTPEELDQLYKSNPSAAHKAIREGRVSRDESWPGTG